MASLVGLPNLYCLPSDVFDLLGTAGTQARLDDGLSASGQQVVVTADAVQGAVSLSVAPLIFPLLKGSVLEFSGGGMAANVEVQLSAVAQTGSLTLAVSALPAAVNNQAAALDSGVNLAQAARLTKACSYGTAAVKQRLTNRYDDSQLATAWSVNRWATAEAALWVCRRRGNPPPASVKDEVDEARATMREIQFGQAEVEDIGTRVPAWPWISNAIVDVRYDIARVRVQPAFSEGSQTYYGQWPDWNTVFLLSDFLAFF